MKVNQIEQVHAFNPAKEEAAWKPLYSQISKEKARKPLYSQVSKEEAAWEPLCGQVSVEDMMAARERRAAIQKRLIRSFGLPIVSFTLNIPGPSKVFSGIPEFFDRKAAAVRNALFASSIPIAAEEAVREATGFEAFFCADAPPRRLKEIAAALEEEEPGGRLCDIDVIRTDGTKVSREDIGLPGRLCLLCKEPAMVCARSRRHTVSELLSCIRRRIGEEEFLDRLADAAEDALFDEVSATPKPGLVDCLDSGSHRDMCRDTFLDSAAAIVPFIRRMAWEGMGCPPDERDRLFSRLRPLGEAAERAMFNAANGANTHKGIIFSMGLLAAAAGVLYRNLENAPECLERLSPSSVLSLAGALCRQEIERDFAALDALKGQTAQKPDKAKAASASPAGQGGSRTAGEEKIPASGTIQDAREVSQRRSASEPREGQTAQETGRAGQAPEPKPGTARSLSHGERLYLSFGCRGIRGEAADGFPSLERIALPALKKAAKELGELKEGGCGAELSARKSGPRGLLPASWNRACLQTLLCLMAQVDDTNVLHRGGPAAAAYVRSEAKRLLAAGGVMQPEASLEALSRMNKEFIKRNISPGGCADLLALSVFLLRLLPAAAKEGGED